MASAPAPLPDPTALNLDTLSKAELKALVTELYATVDRQRALYAEALRSVADVALALRQTYGLVDTGRTAAPDPAEAAARVAADRHNAPLPYHPEWTRERLVTQVLTILRTTPDTTFTSYDLWFRLGGRPTEYVWDRVLHDLLADTRVWADGAKTKARRYAWRRPPSHVSP